MPEKEETKKLTDAEIREIHSRGEKVPGEEKPKAEPEKKPEEK